MTQNPTIPNEAPGSEPRITVAEALSVRAAIGRRIHQLSHERSMNSMALIEKGEEAEYPARTVDLITAELNRAMKDYRQLDVLIAISNTQRTIRWDGQDIAILEAIELAKQLRTEIPQLTALGNRRKLERHTQRGGSEGAKPLFHVALYDPEQYSRAALKSEREAVKLSSLIEQSNHLNTVPFDAEPYMG